MPAPTVASAESRLLVRCGAWMALAGLSTAPSTEEAPNPYTMLAISEAALLLGVEGVVSGAPTDADLAGFASAASIARFNDLAELSLLETIQVNSSSLSASSTRSESFESHTITESNSNSSSSAASPLNSRIDYLRRKYATTVPGVAVGLGGVTIHTTRVRSAQAGTANEF